jgi:8-oxo-dGTP pyrophosphatase MutT (NUDIX family)
VNKNIKKNPKNASAIIVYYKKKFLLNLRSNNKNIFYPKHWGCFGGAKNINEKYIEAAIREFYEETNIKVNKKDMKFFFNLNFTIPNTNKSIRRNFYIFNISNINFFKKNFILSEGIKYRFFTEQSFIKIKKIVPYDKLAIDLFLKYLN